ncbi:EAL domain-containing protein [Azospirillum sp. TSO22-1]|uniref:putative bifunctional diguanylate cyclase/phosphodiesterase n=1 Tax=Azospirillum sp. TSO22-1 TaxID=716789 RepID=UPI000D60EDEC|nr:EAL domain-containing protein [Azospirillum sp. TSO22-1]PWC45784.1 diguanylate cyclase [Azospirillum sp. TSO22-1]
MGVALRALLVEDSPDDAELVATELELGGFDLTHRRVDTLDDLRHALAAEPWDIVISDYHIHTIDASHALSVVLESGKDIPFIIVSGIIQAEQAVALLKRGAHDFLNKDSMARLVPAVERELREASDRRKRRRAEERVRILSLAVEQSPVSVVITNPEGLITYVNPKFTEVAGYTLSEAVSRPLDFTRLADDSDKSYRRLWETVRAGSEWRGEFCNLRRDGSLFWEYATVSPLTGEDGAITHFVAVKEDITVRRSYEERLLRQAYYDSLTALPNRILAFDRIDQAIAAAARSHTQAAVLYADLDRFKNINDAMGHAIGDALLTEAAQRLTACVRECDTVARMGGDEFLIVLNGIEDGRDAHVVAQRIVETFAQPFQLAGLSHYVTASIGITLYPADGTDRQVLIHNADLAMYKAKEMGRNGIHFFTQEINRKVHARLALEAGLRGAVGRGELALHHQPIIDLERGEVVGIEALLRWPQPDGSIAMPGDFIPVAEDSGAIVEIGDWVLATACRHALALGAACGHPLRVAVNVSPRQLRAPGFGAGVAALLAECGLPHDQLELEITESVLLDDAPEATANLRMLCDLGVRLSIDDFGTGYSSLAYLQKYPFRTLKIDRSFVATAPGEDRAGRLVETILALAQSLGLEVIAEGVETPVQLAFLRGAGCRLAQGYLFDRPRPFEAVRAALARSRAVELVGA